MRNAHRVPTFVGANRESFRPGKLLPKQLATGELLTSLTCEKFRLASRRARCASTCEESQAADLAAISAGARFCAITRAAIVACDFCVAVTARFRVLYIFVIIEHASRRLLHWNVTSNPTAAWTLQQLREAIASDHPYRFLVHDRASIYAQALDTSIANLRLRVLKTPYRSPKANSLCEGHNTS